MNGGIAFPLITSPQAFPLNGSERGTAATQAFPLTFVEARPSYFEFRPLVVLEFDSTFRRYGYEGHAASTRFYLPKLLNISEIYKEVPQMWGLYSIGSVTITLDNSDREFSILKDTEAFYGRTGWVAMCEPYYGEGSITRIFTGLIDSWVFQGGKFSITLRDATSERFQNSINQYATVLNTTDFPHLPEYQLPKLVPIAFGLQSRDAAVWGSDSTAIQALPGYLVDPAIGQAKYRYVVLASDMDTLGSVFVYSLLVTTGYTLHQETVDGLLMTFIDFDADPRDLGAHSPDEIEVTVTMIGFKTSTVIPANGIIPSITTAVTINQALTDLYVLFYIWNIFDITTEIDIDSWASAMAAMEATFPTATMTSTEMAIVDETQDIRTILAKHAETFLEWFYMTKDGQLAVTSAFETPVSVATVSDSENIIANSFSISSNRTVASRLQYNYAFNYVREYFEKQPDLHDAGEETNLGQDIRDNRNLWYLRSTDFDQPLTIATKAMESMTENTQLVSFNLPIRYHAAIDVTKAVTLTHFEGIDSSGLGYDSVTVRILSVRFRPHPSDSQIEIKGIVIP